VAGAQLFELHGVLRGRFLQRATTRNRSIKSVA
jgi:hypothetical protein